MTIYEFTDDMIVTHNELVKAREAFKSAVDEASRTQSLTERHRQRWIDECFRISENSPLMVKDEPVKAKDVYVDYDWRTEAKSLGISMFQRSKADVIKEIEAVKLQSACL